MRKVSQTSPFLVLVLVLVLDASTGCEAPENPTDSYQSGGSTESFEARPTTSNLNRRGIRWPATNGMPTVIEVAPSSYTQFEYEYE